MTDKIATLLLLIPALPLGAAILTAVLGPRVLRQHSHLPTVLAVLLSCFCSLLLVQEVGFQQSELSEASAGGFERVYTLWSWAHIEQAQGPAGGPSADFAIDVTLRADALTAIMLAMVTFISSLVAIYSVGYMHGDRGYWRFFAYISLFIFSMTMLVSVSNFVLLYVFWEAVGLCSYLLIGFWYQKPAAAAAGKKAFLVNRVGDFGFALGVFLIWTTYGTLNFHTPSSAAPMFPAAAAAGETTARDVPEQRWGVLARERIAAGDYVGRPGSGRESVALAICLLLMLGACGKSAQFPLHVWLPDAMEGPTPVSALIHAATMVTAGVYLVVRCTPLLMVSPDGQLVVACIGGGTALLAALIALTQYDLKRILAYSTISQLGYMFLAAGTGTLAGISAGMFHLFTHGFFKALLFLGAGSVMHAMGGVIDIRRFGGLRRLLPVTHWTFLIGALALAGVLPFAGFWSKDAIVAAVHEKAQLLEARPEPLGAASAQAGPLAEQAGGNGPRSDWPEAMRQRNARIYEVLYWVAMLTGLLTAFYTFRALVMTFYGPEQLPREAHGHGRESPWSMCGPMVVLAFCAAFVGLMLDHTAFAGGAVPLHVKHPFAAFLGHAPPLAAGMAAATPAPGEFHARIAGLSTLAALVGIGLAFYLYLGDEREVRWLTRVMQFEWLSRAADVEWISRLKQLRGVAATDRLLRQVGLGWLSSLLGYLLLVLLLVLAAPIFVGYFVSPYRLSSRKFYFDELYGVVSVWPLRALAAVSDWWDRWILDGLVDLVGRIPAVVGSLMRSLQMGLVSFYALAMVLGTLILLAARMLWHSP